MESFATGLKRIHEACTESGVKVEFIREPYGFTVRFHRHCGEGWKETQKNNQNAGITNLFPQGEIKGEINDVLNLLKKEPQITIEKISNETGLTKKQIEAAIKELKERGTLSREGSKKTGRWIVKDSNVL